MKLIKDKVAKLSFVALLVTMTAAIFYTPTASAHGEKSQAAFMRMRTIHWFDMNWSKEEVAINDTMSISGQLDMAQQLLEDEILKSPESKEIEQELLTIYEYSRNNDQLIALGKKLVAQGVTLSEEWNECQQKSATWGEI